MRSDNNVNREWSQMFFFQQESFDIRWKFSWGIILTLKWQWEIILLEFLSRTQVIWNIKWKWNTYIWDLWEMDTWLRSFCDYQVDSFDKVLQQRVGCLAKWNFFLTLPPRLMLTVPKLLLETFPELPLTILLFYSCNQKNKKNYF